ncbi:MAG: hypothetical protein J0L81_16115 [Caulobacterales bacterium]|jgi:hypothetical protein|nr:hypothetical protein [Caulobacterales bacterium]
MIEWIARGLAALVALVGLWSVWRDLRSGATKFVGAPPVLRSYSPVTYVAIIGVYIAAGATLLAVALGIIELA